MTNNSRLFDGIRISATKVAAASKAPVAKPCDHPGCQNEGKFKAPKGRGAEGQFHNFCMVHVKAYNATYNYFNGMNDDALAAYQKEAISGHRPTWKLGVNAKAARTADKADPANRKRSPRRTADPFDLFGESVADARKPAAEEPKIGNAARASLTTLDLEPSDNSATIKMRYKELVKRLHPDANGGDRSREERLAEIIKAYAYLKSVGRV